MYKILIIDDNHSFIDSFKVMLKDYSLQIDSTYKFQAAREMLNKSGSYKNSDELDSLIQYNSELDQYNKTLESVQKEKKTDTEIKTPLKIPENLVITQPPFHPDGYLLVIAEYDAESSTKAIPFIQEMVRTNNSWDFDDFICLTTKMETVEPIAKQLNIKVFEKPMKQSSFKSFIEEKIQHIRKLENLINDIVEDNKKKIKINTQPRRKKTTTNLPEKPTTRTKSIPKKSGVSRKKK